MKGYFDKATRWLANIPDLARHIFSGLYLAFTGLVSLLPADTLKKVPTFFENEDKVAHFLIYGGMALTLCWAFPRQGRKQLPYYAAIMLFCTGYGLLIEILQGSFTQLGRSFSWYDEAVNISGAIAFTIAWKLFSKKST